MPASPVSFANLARVLFALAGSARTSISLAARIARFRVALKLRLDGPSSFGSNSARRHLACRRRNERAQARKRRSSNAAVLAIAHRQSIQESARSAPSITHQARHVYARQDRQKGQHVYGCRFAFVVWCSFASSRCRRRPDSISAYRATAARACSSSFRVFRVRLADAVFRLPCYAAISLCSFINQKTQPRIRTVQSSCTRSCVCQTRALSALRQPNFSDPTRVRRPFAGSSLRLTLSNSA